MPLPTPPPPPPPPKTPFPTPSTHQTPEMTRNLDHHHHKQQQSIHNNPAPQPPPPQQQQSDPMSFVRQLREQRRLSMLDNDDDESDDWITHSSRDDIIFSILQKHDSSTTTTQQCRPPRKRPSQDLGTHPRRHSAPLTAQLAQNPPQKPFLDHHHHHLYTSAINTLLASRIINPLNLISQVLVNATMSSAAAYHHHHTSSSSSSNNNSPLQENEDKNVGTVADLSSPKSNEPLKRLRELKLDEMVVVGGGGIISRRSAFEKDRFERMIGFGAASCAKQEDPPPAPPPPATDNQKRRKQHNNNQATPPPPQSSQPHSLSDLQAQVMQIVCDMVTCAKRDVSNVEEAETLLIMLVERCWHSLIILFMVERHIDPEVIDRESKRIEAGDERTELEVLFERAKILAAKDKEVFRLVRKWILFNSGCPKLRPQRQKCSLELAAHSKNIHQNGLARYARIARFMPAIAQLQQQTVKSLVWDSIFDGTDVVLLIDHLCSL